MQRGLLAPLLVAVAAAIVALVHAWQEGPRAPLSFILLAGVGAAVAAVPLALRAAPFVLGVLFILLGLPLLGSGGAYALAIGALLVTCGALAPAPAPAPDRHAAA
ncbi:MAG TPA: hypothetical protein VFH78_06650 [Candidatus Thermoplasmatota archaeon]|nr:hypothetical protein [Candidatus Thermoplasmatota archaeon]